MKTKFLMLQTFHCILCLATFLFSGCLLSGGAHAVTGVNPTGVNVNHTGVTTVFLTFQNLGPNEQALEAFWCSDVVATGVSAFNPCVSGTILGTLPVRNNLSRDSGTGGTTNLTDVMTIPASVARRAFQRAQTDADGSFFYVRRFNDGVNDTYITVTCRMAGGGARTPLALTEVKIQFETEAGLRPVYYLDRDQQPPPITAKIKYNGTGRLKGRWEVVLPGDVEPTSLDLLTEATLPVEQRSGQRRYTLLSRFDVFLPPTGEVQVPGPDPEQIPSELDGAYKILFRVEASADKEGNSDTLAGTAISGGIAGFPMPVLRYFIGTPDALDVMRQTQNTGEVRLLAPGPEATLSVGQPLVFSWQPLKDSPLYELEVVSEGESIFKAIVKGGTNQYSAPPWISNHTDTELRWRVRALAIGGDSLGGSDWQNFTLTNP